MLYAVEVEKAYANLALDQLLSEVSLSKADRGFMTELVYNTLRWRNTIDWVLVQVLKVKKDKLTPWIRNILRLGVYQLLFMDRIPAAAVCNESTNLAKHYGHSGVANLVNGVLRNIARQGQNWDYPDCSKDPVKHVAVCYSHPEWVVERWINRYGLEETIALCQANNRPSINSIRVNTLRISPEELAFRLQEEDIEVEKSKLIPEGLRLKQIPAFRKLKTYSHGLFQIQDESSMLPAYGLNPLPGSQVVDACAGPGGKTTHLAQLMKNQGQIIALDLYGHKIELIRENCFRLGINIVKPFVKDARELPGSWKGWADYVLVDAPCSGLGVLRRRPDARWRKDPQQLQELPALQLEILQAASQCVRPGGVLLYSTCTLEPEENEEVIQTFLRGKEAEKLKDNPKGIDKSNNYNATSNCFYLEDLTDYLPFKVWRKEDQFQVEKGQLTLLPHIHETDGFYLARLRRYKE